MAESLKTHAASLFDSLPWPDSQIEHWRRTDLARLLPKGTLDTAAALDDFLEPLPESGSPLLPEKYSARIITENGRLSAMSLSPEAREAGLSVEWAADSKLPSDLQEMGQEEMEANSDRITAWHWRDMAGALVISLPESARITSPVVVEERLIGRGGQSSLFTAPHLHVRAAKHSELSVIWSFEGSPNRETSPNPVVNASISADAADNAKLNLTFRQSLGKHVTLFMNDRIQAGRDARCRFTETHFGAALVKTRARGIMAAEGADIRLNGLYVAAEGRHMDIGTVQEHRSPHTFSNALYKGAIRPGGRTIFQGLIEVSPKAAKTDAYLTNNNLVLGDGARADSLPQLDILTDDVRCSHGSTTGKLDESQLFYLQSRLFSPEEAVRELTRGFLSVVIDEAPREVREILSLDLENALLEAQGS